MADEKQDTDYEAPAGALIHPYLVMMGALVIAYAFGSFVIPIGMDYIFDSQLQPFYTYIDLWWSYGLQDSGWALPPIVVSLVIFFFGDGVLPLRSWLGFASWGVVSGAIPAAFVFVVGTLFVAAAVASENALSNEQMWSVFWRDLVTYMWEWIAFSVAMGLFVGVPMALFVRAMYPGGWGAEKSTNA